ncbi:hypothetical protein, partial [Nostoc commune]|uniref:hypothetical protein n=1 Tax=Nostoc commune TaxID=1178 RepID=UPI001E6434B8
FIVVFSLPTIHYFFLASRFAIDYQFEKRGYSTCGITIFYHALYKKLILNAVLTARVACISALFALASPFGRSD